MIELSILICTTNARNEVIKPLIAELERQTKGMEDMVEVILNNHETDNVGKKRNDLLKVARGRFVSAIDSDDIISPYYISLILEAIEQDTDCIGINGIITTNDKNQMQWFISKEYGSWYQSNGIYYRTPNHISPVKREIALMAMFPEVSFAEDFEYSKRILPMLKTETIISAPIYHYRYRNDERK